MEKKLFLPVFAMVAVLLVGTAFASSSCQTFSTPNIKVIGTVWGNSTHQISAAPGQRDVPLTVTLESYDTNCEFENMVGSLQTYGGITDFQGSSASTTYLQSIQPPSIFTMTFYLDIASNISVGQNTTLTFPLILQWDSLNGTINSKQQINIGVPMHGAANLTFSALNPDITAGKITNITLEVKNTGSGLASGIGTAISGSSGTGVSLLSQPQQIENLAPNRTANVTFKAYVSPQQAGNSQSGASIILDLVTHYINPYGYNTSMDSQLGLFASTPSSSSLLVSVANQSLLAGKIVKTNITLTNTGADPITNVSAVLTPESPLSIIGSDNLNTVYEILPGKSAGLPVELYVQSSTSAVATLDIALTYTLDNQQNTASRSISFTNPGYVNATIVSTTISPSSPSKGSIFSITSTLDNIGASPATAASVTPFPPAGIKILGSNTSFLGTIPIDTPTAFTVSFTADPGIAAGAYAIPVRLSYLNNLNEIQNQTFHYTVNIGSSSGIQVANGGSGTTRIKGGGGGLLIAGIVVIIVIAGAGVYFYRKRSGKKGHAK